MYTDTQLEILQNITEEIGTQSKSCAAEQYSPGHDPDASDEHIKTRAANVRDLRRIREELEDIFTGMIPR